MNDEQKKAYEWAKQQNYGSVAATYARELAGVIDELQSQLAKANRRADAAEIDIMCSDHCDVCKHNRGDVAECYASDFKCGDCKSDNCVCRHCRDEDKWEWRGAEKGAESEKV